MQERLKQIQPLTAHGGIAMGISRRYTGKRAGGWVEDCGGEGGVVCKGISSENAKAGQFFLTQKLVMR